jgi:alkylhydroperoxidase family enzyme
LRRAAYPTNSTNEVRQHFSEKELADLTLAIAAINAWNRLAISASIVPGSYEVPKVKIKQTA